MHTILVSVKPDGRISHGYISNKRTASQALAGFLKEKKIPTSSVADAVVILGATGSILLHQSAGQKRNHTEPTREELEAAFAKVLPAERWKRPIDKVLPNPGAEQLELICKAIAYFTGSLAHVIPAAKGKVRIRAAGYYDNFGS